MEYAEPSMQKMVIFGLGILAGIAVAMGLAAAYAPHLLRSMRALFGG